MSAAPKRAPRLLTAEDGRQLAIDMLRELEAMRGEEMEDCLMADGRTPVRNNIVARYLRALGAARSPDAETMFASVLTDFIAGAVDGAVADAEFYEGAAQEPPQ